MLPRHRISRPSRPTLIQRLAQALILCCGFATASIYTAQAAEAAARVLTPAPQHSLQAAAPEEFFQLGARQFEKSGPSVAACASPGRGFHGAQQGRHFLARQAAAGADRAVTGETREGGIQLGLQRDRGVAFGEFLGKVT